MGAGADRRRRARRRSRGAAARQRAPAPARRRAGRHLPLRRPRLEPDHRARPGGDRPRAAHLLGRLPATRATTSAPTRSRSRARSAPPPRRRRRRRARSPPRSRRSSGTPRRRWSAPLRCRSTCSPARCASRASPSSRPARAPTSCSGATTCSRRSCCASCTGATPSGRCELLDQLYPYLGGPARRGPAWRRFLLETRRRRRPARLAPDARVRDRRRQGASTDPRSGRELDASAALDRAARRAPGGASTRWSALERAAWLEVTTLLEPYLLAAQGDRVAMAHGVEGRYPFLDHRVFAHAARAAAEREARRAARQGRAARARRERAAADDRRAAASSPTGRPRSRPFFAPEAPGLGRGALSPAALERDRHLGPSSGSQGLCAAAAPGARPACARAWPSSASSRPSSGIASSSVAAAAGYPPETAEPQVRIDRTSEPRAEEARMTER